MNVGHRSPPVNVASFFSGGAGLDRGFKRAWRAARTVVYVEVEAFPCAVLASQMEAGALDPAPIWTDARSFGGSIWRGQVDCIIGGFPCTDLSRAGKRAGLSGEHSGLWFQLLRCIREVGPSIVFLENVSALTSGGLDTVLGGLAEVGLDAEWSTLRASEVGAPHERDRVFILAWNQRGLGLIRENQLANAHGGAVRVEPEWRPREGSGEREAEREHAQPIEDGVAEVLADAASFRVGEPDHRPSAVGGGRQGSRKGPVGGGIALANTEGFGFRQGGAEQPRHDRKPAPISGSDQMADANGAEWWSGPGPGVRGLEGGDSGREEAGRTGGVANCGFGERGREALRPESAERFRAKPERQGGSESCVGNPDGEGFQGRWIGGGNDANEEPPRSTVGQVRDWPPGPEDREGWEIYLRKWPGTEPGFRRSVDGLAGGVQQPDGSLADPRSINRIDRLRILGNGVVEAQADHAARGLGARALT